MMLQCRNRVGNVPVVRNRNRQQGRSRQQEETAMSKVQRKGNLVAVASAEDVREWARKRGVEVAEHGRLSAEVIAAFNKAHTRVQYRSTMRQPERIIKVPGKATRNGQT